MCVCAETDADRCDLQWSHSTSYRHTLGFEPVSTDPRLRLQPNPTQDHNSDSDGGSDVFYPDFTEPTGTGAARALFIEWCWFRQGVIDPLLRLLQWIGRLSIYPYQDPWVGPTPDPDP